MEISKRYNEDETSFFKAHTRRINGTEYDFMKFQSGNHDVVAAYEMWEVDPVHEFRSERKP